MDDDDKIYCFICLQPVCVPVKIIAFSCREDVGKPNCHDLHRACMYCARAFLQMNMPENCKSSILKCPFCPAVCNPKFLYKNTFRKDFLLISFLKEKIKCPNNFCNFQGTQASMDKHLELDCNSRWRTCTCGNPYQLHNYLMHKQSCPDFIHCRLCNCQVHIDEIENHYELDHQSKICQFCNDIYKIIEKHEQTCPEGTLECPNCKKIMYRKNYHDHIHDEYKIQKEKIKKEIDKLKIILKSLNFENPRLHFYKMDDATPENKELFI